MTAPDQTDKRHDVVSVAVIVGFTLLVGIVVWRMLCPPEPVDIVIRSDASGESFSAAAALAMGERMGQSAEWTIATVLVIGSALIGLNWYQGDKRHQHDMRELEKKISSVDDKIEKRLQVIEFATVGALEYINFKSIDDALGDPNQLGYVQKGITFYRNAGAPQLRSAMARVLIELARSARDSPITLPVVGEVTQLEPFVRELRGQFPDLADQLQQAIDAVYKK